MNAVGQAWVTEDAFIVERTFLTPFIYTSRFKRIGKLLFLDYFKGFLGNLEYLSFMIKCYLFIKIFIYVLLVVVLYFNHFFIHMFCSVLFLFFCCLHYFYLFVITLYIAYSFYNQMSLNHNHYDLFYER